MCSCCQPEAQTMRNTSEEEEEQIQLRQVAGVRKQRKDDCLGPGMRREAADNRLFCFCLLFFILIQLFRKYSSQKTSVFTWIFLTYNMSADFQLHIFIVGTHQISFVQSTDQNNPYLSYTEPLCCLSLYPLFETSSLYDKFMVLLSIPKSFYLKFGVQCIRGSLAHGYFATWTGGAKD